MHLLGVQVVDEPEYVYGDYYWCEHAAPPAVRIDTSLMKFRQNVYNASHTSYLWTPYSNHFVQMALKQFTKRVAVGSVPGATPLGMAPPPRRPFFAAYMSSDCKPHRDFFFNVLAAAATAAALPDGAVHGLGLCSHTNGVDQPAMNLYGPYDNYRWAIVFENTCEVGYVTEKLGSALFSGAVPIYWGDSAAAKLVFNNASYVDAREFWNANGMAAAANDIAAAGNTEMLALAEHVIEIDRNPTAYANYLLDDVIAAPEGASNGDDGVDDDAAAARYPFPYPSARMDPESEAMTRPRVLQAVQRLRNQYKAGRVRRAAAAAAVGKTEAAAAAAAVTWGQQPEKWVPYFTGNWRMDAWDALDARRAEALDQLSSGDPNEPLALITDELEIPGYS